MKLFVKNTRDLSFVPISVWAALFLSLSLQCYWHWSSSNLEIKRYELPAPPNASLVRLVSLDDSVPAAKWVMLWLQAFDNQPGISIPLKELDYGKVIEWLDLILELDNKIQYPLLAAIRFYAEVVDEKKQRTMVDYISKEFIKNPNERWPFMAHAVYIAKHRIKDQQLALACSKLIRQYATGENVPYWAKQMEIFVLEDMGELESAKILIGGLLDSGELTDSQQINFLSQRLLEIEERQNKDPDATN
ncbi:MAG: hypothetical protein DHS20C09_14830 [marine bacterium B5-7]|nr:MAG: hypothetical protein DHS20C09_14830 [marine bacterium B5-7]